MQDLLVMLDDLVSPCKGLHGKLVRMTIHEAIKAARQKKGWSMEKLAEEIAAAEGLAKPLAWQTVQQWEKLDGTAPKRKRLKIVADLLDLSSSDLVGWDDPDDASPVAVAPATPGQEGTGSIDVVYAKGSCGGGSFVAEAGNDVREQLIKESAWFKRYGVKPSQVIAIYADGDSMADFIVDGDIVIFKKGYSALVSGKIYVLDTPDGLRIKRVHKRSDGTIILSSDNDNKRRYPDEEYSPEQASLLQIKGTFVYRQGG